METRQVRIEVEGLPIQLTLVTNVDALLDQLLAKGDQHEDVRDERIPYWADLWPSAIGMSRYLIQMNLIRPGMKVLEIGCGLGLPGIVAGKLGAEVTLSDYLPDALDFAAGNWAQNSLELAARYELMDWRSPRPELAADLVLASDVAYETRAFDPLANAFQSLCLPGGRILISEPDREMARSFMETLTLDGFSKTHSLVEGIYDELNYRVHIYDFNAE